ncbi:hypothetical protein OIU80_19105 [Flavobacterium sp. LS1R47]|uniref:Structural protein P5 n=1 Tax=Flavobacterium frigoritolerans TaxID=2987686 RepID=A0A9X3CA50_9FLAO|nr:hypothetical protein [Flavobacterium frigoritolerans]MCV9934393.1 hypothetical protein [Flavobacterium frigoritolerans]
MSSFLGRKDLTRGIRNNNPGNLRLTNIAWQGKIPNKQNTDKEFEQFTDVKFGIRAMLRDLTNDIDKGKNTIRKLISEYAPPSENNTQNYIDVVSKAVGLAPDQTIKIIDAKFYLVIARAIIKHECSPNHNLIFDSDIQDAIDIVGDYNLSGVTVTAQKKFRFNYLIIPVLLFFYTVYSVTV